MEEYTSNGSVELGTVPIGAGPEINDLQLVGFLADEHYVLWLQIPVNYLTGVAVGNS